MLIDHQHKLPSDPPVYVDQTWTEIMMPTIERFELAAKFEQNIEYTPEGARALGALIRIMARLLDLELEKEKMFKDSTPIHRLWLWIKYLWRRSCPVK
jgi:hypothetical protein